ncbi:MAG TPA: SMC-Scp complex subunit ScpB [Methyloceanibacter sp.]|jgi:segregation and condensation protein B|nr:SMC-Scp complex subunit ScpB [Methyloceanibacter sp.]
MTEDETERERGGPRLLLPLPSNVIALQSTDRREKLRIVEALLFAASEPLDEAALAQHFVEGEDMIALLEELQSLYAARGVNLVKVAGKWAFRTADDLSFLLEKQAVEQRRLSRAALETLAIIAYHQPVTRAEIEEIRGVSTSSGTIDILLETGWIKLRGRRRAPGRPVTYGTTASFLEHFGFDQIQDLPGLNELKGAGLLDSNLPPGFSMPNPNDALDLREDEEPLEDEPLAAEPLAEDEGSGEPA